MQSPGDGFFYQRWSARYSGLYSEQSWKVRNFPLNFQATVRNKSGAKFSRAKNSRCEIFPPPVHFIGIYVTRGVIFVSHRIVLAEEDPT